MKSMLRDRIGFKAAKWVGMAFLAALAVVGVATNEAVWAEDNGSDSSSKMTSMTVSPMNQQIILTPGEVYQGSVKVTNSVDSPGPLKYSVGVGSFSQRADENSVDDYGVIDTQAVSNYNQMMQWITVDPTNGEIQPNDTQVVNFTITVPDDAPAGGQYATLLFQNDSEREEHSGNVNIESKFQIASIIYADVTGETRNEGKILDNAIPGFLLAGPLKAEAMVENDGNVHTDATYTLQVWPLFSDEEICTNEDKPGKSLVMPETKQYHVEECTLGIAGIYRAKQTVTIFGETSVVEATVFLCPIWLLLVILAVIVVIIVMIVKRVKKGKKFAV